MKFDNKYAMKLYAVTDRTWSTEQSFLDSIEDSLKGGITCLQLREKTLDDKAFLEEALQVKELCRKYKVPFIINDHVEVAIKSDADGIHIGQSDTSLTEVRKKLKNKIIGVSVKTREQALEAEKNGADYLGVGAVFQTTTKLDASEVSYDTVKEICSSVNIPVVAIGGIQLDNIKELQGTHVDGIAVISAIYSKENIQQSTEELLREVNTNLLQNQMKTVLTIAGSDCSGGAGIQADLKTMTVHGVYGMSCITALTAQNTTGVYAIEDVSPEFVEKQLDAIFKDIYPDAIKIGMVSNSKIITSIVRKLKEYNARNIVIDPVMVATSGDPLISNKAMDTLIHDLMPLGTVVTPNIPEAEKLSGITIDSEEKMIEAAKIISQNMTGSLLIKGGHFGEKANDLLYTKDMSLWFTSERYHNKNTHGTGCTLSSAIASNLAKNFSVTDSIRNSKSYISGAIKNNMNLGKGRGPLNHMY